MGNDVATLGIKVDSRQVAKAGKDLEVLTTRARKAERATDGLSRSSKKTQTATGNLANSMRGLGAAMAGVGAVMIARKLIEYSDGFTSLQNKVRLVTNSTKELTSVTESLFNVAKRSRTEIGSAGALYQKLAIATESLGISTKEALRLTETITKSFTLTGASAAESAGAIRQLGQGLNAGALRGEEFNSVAEQAPLILRAMTTTLGKTKAELREFAATGGITAEIVIKALQSIESEVDTALVKSVETFGQKMTAIENDFIQWSGASEGLADSLNILASSIDAGAGSARFLIENIDAIVVLMLARQIPAIQALIAARSGAIIATQKALAADLALAKSTKATTAFELEKATALRASTLADLQAEQVRLRAQITQTGRNLSLKRTIELSRANVGATALLTAATNAHSASLIRVTAAQSAFNVVARAGVVASRALGVAMSLMGGPIGIAVVVAYGMYAYVTSLETADERTKRLKGSVNDLTEEFKKLSVEQQASTMNQTAANIASTIALLTEAKTKLQELSSNSTGGFFSEEATRQKGIIKELSDEIIVLTEKYEKMSKFVGGKLTANLNKLFDKPKKATTELSKSTKTVIDRYIKLANTVGRTARAQAIYNDITHKGIAIASSEGQQILAVIDLYFKRKDIIESNAEATENLARATEKAADDSRRALQKLADDAENRFDSMQDKISETFSDGFENIGQSFRDMIKRMIADFAASGLLRMIGFTGAGALGFSSIANGSTGGGGGLESFGISSAASSAYDTILGEAGFTGLFKEGGLTNAYNNLSSSLSGFGDSVSSFFGGGATGSQTTANGLQAMNANLSNTGAGLPINASFDWLNAGANMGAGIIGGMAGTAIGEAAFGKHAGSAWGSTAGAAIGAFLGAGNPWFTGIGAAIGGLFDAAFGSSLGPAFSVFQSDLSAGPGRKRSRDNSRRVSDHDTSGIVESGFGDLRFSTSSDLLKGQGEADAIFAILDALAEVENKIASSQTASTISEIAQSIGDFKIRTEGAVPIIDVFADRFDKAFSVIGGTADELYTILQENLSPDEIIAGIDGIATALIDLDGVTDDIVSAFKQGLISLDQLSNVANAQKAITDLFIDEEEKLAQNITALEQAFQSVGLVLPKTTAGMIEMVNGLELNTRAGIDQLAALTLLAQATKEYIVTLEDTKTALGDLFDFESVTDTAFAQLRSTADREKASIAAKLKTDIAAIKAAESLSLTDITNRMSVTQSAANNLRSLMTSITSVITPMTRTQGQAQIQNVLSSAQSGESLQNVDLSGALKAVGKPSQHLFSTFTDYQRDLLKTNQALIELENYTEDQLSVEERTFSALEMLSDVTKSLAMQQIISSEGLAEKETQLLNSQIDLAQIQINALRNIDASVITVAQSVEALTQAVDTEAMDKVSKSESDIIIEGLYDSILNTLADEEGKQFYVDMLASGEKTFSQISKDLLWSLEMQSTDNVETATNQTNALRQFSDLELQALALLGFDITDSATNQTNSLGQFSDLELQALALLGLNITDSATNQTNSLGQFSDLELQALALLGFDITDSATNQTNALSQFSDLELQALTVLKDSIHSGTLSQINFAEILAAQSLSVEQSQLNTLISIDGKITAINAATVLPAVSDNKGIIEGLYSSILNRPSDSAGLNFYTGLLDNNTKTLVQIIKEMTASAEGVSLGVPQFASGGVFGGGLRIVGENGPELEATGASRISSNNNLRAMIGNDEIVAEVRQLRADVREVGFKTITKLSKSAKILDTWDGNGLPEQRVV